MVDIKGEAWFESQLPILQDLITLFEIYALIWHTDWKKELEFCPKIKNTDIFMIMNNTFMNNITEQLVHHFLLCTAMFEPVDLNYISALVKVSFLLFSKQIIFSTLSSQDSEKILNPKELLKEAAISDLNEYKEEIIQKSSFYCTRINCVLRLIVNSETSSKCSVYINIGMKLLEDEEISTILSIPNPNFDSEQLNFSKIHQSIEAIKTEGWVCLYYFYFNLISN